MPNQAIGGILEIPEAALKKIKETDDRIADIQKRSNETAAVVKKSFLDMARGTDPFIEALDKVIAKLGVIGTSSANASAALGNIGASAGSMNGNITQATQSIQQMALQLSNMKGAGTSGIMQAAMAFERLQTAMQNKSGMNIAGLKEEITAINSTLKDKSYGLTQTEQDDWVKRKKSLQDELKFQEQMYNERAVAFQKALDRMASAEMSFNAKQRAAAARTAAAYKEKNYAKNTTYQGALDFSATANTLNRQAKAVEYLEAAKRKLSQTDSDYKTKLDALNAAIRQHNKNLNDAKANTQELATKTSYLAGSVTRLMQRMAVMFTLNSAKSMIEQIAEVRGQFELAQRSLESIIQIKPKADEIFNKTVELAIKSPFRIKDLVNYTRQLAAYRIETGKLFDTTKRLADVSAGLGVDMGRLILAYGQVKAAAYLRGSEVRQFTEAGVNMYGELQEYFKEVKGEAYTTAQIVDMISKRMVKFEDVEAIFQRMTDKGGMFYNMQEVQANTLYGMLQKMHDAFDVMLNDIGKSNEGAFKGTIRFATEMLKHWEAIAAVFREIVAVLITMKLQSMGVFASLSKGFVAMRLQLALFSATVKNLGFITAFKTVAVAAFDAITRAIKAMGVALKAATLYAAFEIGMNFYNSLTQIYETLKTAHETTVKTLGQISELSIRYKDLSASIAGVTSAQKANEKSDAETIDEKRNVLQKLIDYASKEGLTIKLNVAKLNEKELDEQFRIVEKKYRDFAFTRDAIMTRAGRSDAKGWFWGMSGITEGLQEYKNAAIDIVSQTNKVEQAMSLATANYKDADKHSKQYFDTLRKGRQDGEEDIDYLIRMNEAWGNLEAYYSRTKFAFPQWFTQAQGYMNDLSGDFEKLNSAIAQTKENFKDVFIGKGGVEEFKKKYQKEPLELKEQIDTYASEKSLSDTEKRLLYWVASHEYKIKIQVNEKSVENTIDYVDKTIQNFIDSKHYKINIDANNISDPLKKYREYFENMEKEQKTLQETEEWMNRIITKGKGKKNGMFVFNQSDFKDDELALMGIPKKIKTNFTEWGKKQSEEISVTAAQLKKLAQTKLGSIGATFDEWEWETKDDKKNDKKKRKEEEKEKRDILQERISLLEDMRKKYNELLKTETKETALAKTRSYFKEAAEDVGWKAQDILPDNESVQKRLTELARQIKDRSKRGKTMRMVADISFEISDNEYNELKDDISRNVEEAFSQMQLYRKLKDAGVADELIKGMYGDITKSFQELGDSINDEFNRYIFRAYSAKHGEDIDKWSEETVQKYNDDLTRTEEKMSQSGKEIYKQYLDAKTKMQEKQKQETIDTFLELTKAYKTQLSEQLQLEKWHIEQKRKIMDNVADNDTQQEYLRNLEKQYRAKSAANTWKDFQNSDMYVRLFENLEHASSKVLSAMEKKLQSMRDGLKDLDPAQLKAVAQQLQKVQEVKSGRNPFKAIIQGIDDLKKARKELEALGGVDRYVTLSDQQQTLKEETKEIQRQIDLNEDLAKSEKAVGAAAKAVLPYLRNQLKAKQKQLNLTDEQIDKLGSLIDAEAKAKNTLTSTVSAITQIVSTLGNGINGLLSALGVTDTQTQNIVESFSSLGETVGAAMSGNIVGAIQGGLSFITSVVKIFTDESGIDKEIERQQRAINSLQNAYDGLKKSMNDAFSVEQLLNYHDKSVKELEKEKAAYAAMIAAEQKRKKPDEGKIQDWQQQMQSIDDTIKELRQTMTEELGGFGSEANYKSAAQAFADAWVDAFNEGSDSLEALNDKFDEYFNNMLKKQVAQRATERFIRPILEAFDKAVSEGSAGANNGLDITKEEIDHLEKLKKTNLEAYDKYLSNFMELLGVSPTASKSLSALQQGIQSITESTGQALESVLNSLRFYVAQSQSDIRIIRDTLIQRLGTAAGAITQESTSNPVLLELQVHTTLLTEIRDTISNCTKAGHRLGRNGIKVFMD